ncbi:MAG TPA: hypothetical protein VFQ23_13130 [Anaerolineales bacterium]|nr:hypothetical protein [Anaerolineales bacterium]
MSKTTARWIYWGMFFYILATISVAVLVIAFHIHPTYSAPLMCTYTLSIFMLMIVHPFKRWVTRERKKLFYGDQ